MLFRQASPVAHLTKRCHRVHDVELRMVERQRLSIAVSLAHGQAQGVAKKLHTRPFGQPVIGELASPSHRYQSSRAKEAKLVTGERL